MRLTEKEKINNISETGFYKIKETRSNTYVTDLLGNTRECNNLFLAQQKLASLEDIEDKLGIDLATLFKALKHFYFVDKNSITGKNEIYHICKNNVEYSLVRESEDWLIQIRWVEGNIVHHYASYDSDIRIETRRFYLEDYGETWALTKEELE